MGSNQLNEASGPISYAAPRNVRGPRAPRSSASVASPNKWQEDGGDHERSNADGGPPGKNATSTKSLQAAKDEGCEDRVGGMEWGTAAETGAPEHSGAQQKEQVPHDEEDRQRHQDGQ